MGYDMSQRNRPEGEGGYFSLNIFGMGRYRELMARFGMAFHDTPHPEWPKTENYGITDEDFWAVEYPEDYADHRKSMTPETLAKVAEYQTAMTQILMWHGKADTPGIPLHKFGSNDGWIVLPAECTAAVKAWRAYCQEHGEATAVEAIVNEGSEVDYWNQWIAYLEDSANRDGFEVH